MSDIRSWHIVGDWFDNCSCAVPYPCTFAQVPDNRFCESVLFWRVREGHYGDVKLGDRIEDWVAPSASTAMKTQRSQAAATSRPLGDR